MAISRSSDEILKVNLSLCEVCQNVTGIQGLYSNNLLSGTDVDGHPIIETDDLTVGWPFNKPDIQRIH